MTFKCPTIGNTKIIFQSKLAQCLLSLIIPWGLNLSKQPTYYLTSLEPQNPLIDVSGLSYTGE